jgi:hypothetical protein
MGATSPRRLYFAVRNHLLLASRVGPQHAPVRHLRAAHIVGLNLAHTMVRSRVRLADGLAALGRGVRDHWNGRYGPDDSTNR